MSSNYDFQQLIKDNNIELVILSCRDNSELFRDAIKYAIKYAQFELFMILIDITNEWPIWEFGKNYAKKKYFISI